MRKLAFIAVACGALGLAAPASAGCLGGAVVGGVVGHMAGHGVAGAAAGCAIGHHSAAKKARAAQQQNDRSDQTQTH